MLANARKHLLFLGLHESCRRGYTGTDGTDGELGPAADINLATDWCPRDHLGLNGEGEDKLHSSGVHVGLISAL